jgi:hypothetical protein
VQKALDDMVDAFTEAIYGEWFTTHGRMGVPSAESLAMPISVESANRRKLPQGNPAGEKNEHAPYHYYIIVIVRWRRRILRLWQLWRVGPRRRTRDCSRHLADPLASRHAALNSAQE